MPTFMLALPLIQQALATISMFQGSAQAAKNVGYVQDAVGVVSALAPLVVQFAGGREVTAEDVRGALAGKDAALKVFDDLIATKTLNDLGRLA